ncbi:MAG: hypothetical protein SV760_06645 [Halobacteria archaeon]|nr:hypothetical protein [Halobacteria archaeon]
MSPSRGWVDGLSKPTRYAAVAGILLVVSAVFYVTLRVFTSRAVVADSGAGFSVSSGALGLKIGALIVFVAVSIVGLYACIRLLARPDFGERDSVGSSLVPHIHDLGISSSNPADETEGDRNDGSEE